MKALVTGLFSVLLPIVILSVLYFPTDLVNNKQVESIRSLIDNQLERIFNDQWRPPRVLREEEITGPKYYVYGTVKEIENINYLDETKDDIDNDNLIEAANEWLMTVKLATGKTTFIHFGLDARGTYLGGLKTLVITDSLSEPFKVGDIVKIRLAGPNFFSSSTDDFLVPEVIILDNRQ